MSYCRWSEGDVYLYRSVDDAYHCCDCPLERGPMNTASEALAHLRHHQRHGHRVPDRAFERLKAEIEGD